MSSPRTAALPDGRHRGALDVVAFATLVALDARRVLIAVKVARGWSVHGSATAADSDGLAPTLLRGASGLPLEAPTAVDLVPAHEGEWGLTVPRSASARRPGPPGEGPAVVAIAARCQDGSTVLLVVEQPTRQDYVERLPEFSKAAADATVAADEGHRARARDSLQEREDERRRWARELHDETLQQLGALQVLLTSARRGGRSDGSNGRHGDGSHSTSAYAALDQAAELVQTQITSLRHLINELRPSALDELGLRAPLEALAERTEQLTDMQVEMQVSLPYAEGQVSTRLLPDVELAVYRVVQEALTNAARHSHGTRARVVVVEQEGQVRVEVSDNGTGAGHTTGFGIAGMRERATLAGGHLELLPHGLGYPASRGTTVRMVVPAVHRQPSEEPAAAD